LINVPAVHGGAAGAAAAVAVGGVAADSANAAVTAATPAIDLAAKGYFLGLLAMVLILIHTILISLITRSASLCGQPCAVCVRRLWVEVSAELADVVDTGVGEVNSSV
jgi:hypothetical protein